MTAFGALLALLLLTTFGLGHAAPFFAWLFPGLDQPIYRQDGFPALLLGHLEIVAAASAFAILLGVFAGIAVTRPGGREFRGLLETVGATGQAFPPVAVLALAVPAMGFGASPAIVALALYGLLPVLQNTIAGLENTPADIRVAAAGMGMSTTQILLQIELPLAAPVILTGIRLSVVVGIGTAAIASTVGARTLGLPIIVGLNASNVAYVLQGALLVALLAITLDQGFEALIRATTRWRRAR
ncbi:MAG: ABC transporter permease [Acetobacteraceae bacterium]|nr:ABC transporter permease [Acetobacteraceae bacterium]